MSLLVPIRVGDTLADVNLVVRVWYHHPLFAVQDCATGLWGNGSSSSSGANPPSFFNVFRAPEQTLNYVLL